MVDAFEHIIRRTVEGQIRGFLKEHPSVVEAVDWFKPRQDKATTFTNSLAKRIVRDLACPNTRARLEAALLEIWPAPASTPPVELNPAGKAGRPGRSAGPAGWVAASIAGAFIALVVVAIISWLLPAAPAIAIFGG